MPWQFRETPSTRFLRSWYLILLFWLMIALGVIAAMLRMWSLTHPGGGLHG